MKLGKNSWHARVNKFIFGEDYLESVDCLCPYFWGTILAIVAIPLWLIGHGISRIIDAVENTGFTFPQLHVNRTVKRIIVATLGYTSLFSFVGIIAYMIGLAIIKYGIIHVLVWLGIAVGVVGLFVGTVFVISNIKERYDEWRLGHPKEKKQNLLVAMFYAKKNKHCPLVSWVD